MKLAMEEKFDLRNPVIDIEVDHQYDIVHSLFASEPDHMPCNNYVSTYKTKDLDISIRREAISLILKLQFSCKFDSCVQYLAVNYLDRFISTQEITQGKAWMLKLISISCISLAAKMYQINFSITEFQSEEGFIFDGRTIHRMELLILGSLNWRMRSITPFSFIDFFISVLKLEQDPPLIQTLKSRTEEIIFKSQHEIKLLEFKPSILAASALLSVSREVLPSQFAYLQLEISSCAYVNKEKLLLCCNVMQEIVMDGFNAPPMQDMVSSSRTPDNVLDLRYSSTSSSTVVRTSDQRGDMKRRKIGEDYKSSTFQFSQIQHY